MESKNEYDRLLSDYRDLQLRVTKFSAVEQELINIRDRLDNELEMYKRMQLYNANVLEQSSPQDFVRYTTDAVVDIFETECSFVFFEMGCEKPMEYLYSEGIRFRGMNESDVIPDIRKISREVIDHKRNILYSETLGKQKAFEGIREALWYSHTDIELGYTIHIAGLISFEKGRSYNPLLERHSAIFGIFAQQAVSLLGNFLRGLTIRDQVEKISESATELKKLSLIATKTKSGVIITDHFGRIEWVNDSFVKTTGYTLEDVAGKKPKDFLQRADKDQDPEILKLLSESLAKRETVEVTIKNFNKWGEPYFNQLEITPVFDDQGNHINFIALQKDITTEIRFQKEMLAKNEELKKINAELDNFVYSISHDLRSPLLSIKGILKLVTMKEKLSPNAVGYIQMAEGSVDRLDATVQEILDYSRNSRLDLQISEFDLQNMVNNIFDDLRFGSDGELEMTLQINGKHIIASDRYRLETLLKNIIGNSVKYRNKNAAHPFVHVIIDRQPEKTLISVADNGIGISQNNIEKIFDMFFRATSEVTGTGLGLYICKEILNKLEGSISVESEAGKGTTMYISLPEKNI